MLSKVRENTDLASLLNILLQNAQSFLVSQDGFLPFGASITNSGKFTLEAADLPYQEAPAPQMLELLAQGLRLQAQSAQLRAVGICYDSLVRLPGTANNQKSDAIQCALEHANGDCFSVIQPYTRVSLTEITYGDLFAITRVPKLFVP